MIYKLICFSNLILKYMYIQYMVIFCVDEVLYWCCVTFQRSCILSY